MIYPFCSMLETVRVDQCNFYQGRTPRYILYPHLMSSLDLQIHCLVRPSLSPRSVFPLIF